MSLNQKKEKNVPAITFGILVIVIVASAILSAGYQTNFGTIKVESLQFTDMNGVLITAKLYLPTDASAAHPVPGVLALPGFNNDKNVMRAQAIELAKQGIAVLVPDQEGDGDSGGTYAFLTDPSYNDACNYMLSLPFINASDCGVMGHSLGAIRGAAIVAPAHPTLRMFIFETFSPAILFSFGYNATTFRFIFHNYLHISATWEEFMMSTNETVAYYEAQGLTSFQYITSNPTAVEDTNYGSFANGTATRWALETSTHPGLTADPAVVSEVVAWALQSLKGETYAQAWAAADPSQQTYMGAEIFGLIALGALMVSIMPLGAWLMRTKPFETLKQPRVTRVYWKKSMWWLWASIATAIGGVTYVYCTSFYTGTQPFSGLPTTPVNPLIVPGLGIGVATGFMSWFLINAGIGALLIALWYFLVKKKQPQELTPFDLGAALAHAKGGIEIEGFTPPTDRKFTWNYLARTVVLAFILYAWMYMMILLTDWALNIDMNGIWTEFAPLTTTRAAEFWVYLWPVLAFFVVNGGIYLFGEMKQPELKSGAMTQLAWWLKACYLLLGGLIVVICIQYVPMWFGYGPGLNGNVENASNISPLMPIQLMSFIPFAAVLIFIMVFFYRHTGRIYLGAIIVAVLAVWFEMVGLVIYF